MKVSPEDARSHRVLGRYYCFDDDWKAALPHLAKGSDAALRRLAQRDLACPTEPNEQLKLADAWWELGQTRKSDERDSLILRAGYWYERADKRTSGIVRLRAEKRLGELADIRHRRAHLKKDSPQDLWTDLF